MNFITKCLTQCSDCFNYINYSNENIYQLSDYYINIRNLAQYCLHISNKNDSICYNCFLEFFHYDRFIIRHLFFYLHQQEKSYVHIREFYLFAQCIINWHEFINHTDFMLLLFHIILSKNDFSRTNINFNKNIDKTSNQYFQQDDDILEKLSINSILLYELIEDAFFFTAIQSNVQTKCTHSSQVFLERFYNYFCQLNPNHNCKTYIKLVKRVLPWGFISIHKWLKTCLLSTTKRPESILTMSKEFNSNLPFTFLWYITNWLVSNKVFLNEYDPIVTFEKVSRQELITNLYDSDRHGYSTVKLCALTYYMDGPFLIMFYCNDERIFGILLEGKLMDSAKPYGGRSSLCFQLSPQFIILERGPSMLYWNIKNRSDGPLGVRIGHNGIIRISIDLSMEHIHHPEGSSSINRVEIYKFGSYKIPIIQQQSLIHKQRNDYNVFSIDAHKLAESIGMHLFT
ncbi:unnamed protein product [Rotaria socialis]|uniref:TLDc domain-containing protein n=2 Tax=Rotaria socialis TaxID=392032 RepID=A0A817X1F2_9BILA|nr:unnamed protein product [Rotaria socialis]